MQLCPKNKETLALLMHLTNENKCLKGGCKQGKVRLLSEVLSVRRRGTGHKLEHKSLPLTIKKHFCAVEVMENCHRLPREIMGSPSWRSSKATQIRLWAPCCRCSCLSRVWKYSLSIHFFFFCLPLLTPEVSKA